MTGRDDGFDDEGNLRPARNALSPEEWRKEWLRWCEEAGRRGEHMSGQECFNLLLVVLALFVLLVLTVLL